MIGPGVLVGVYKQSDPRKYFLPRVGVACPVTAILDFRASGTVAAGTRDVILILYDPTRRSAVRLAGAQRPLAADFVAPFDYYPNPGLLLGLAAMMRPQNYEQRTGLYMIEPYDPDQHMTRVLTIVGIERPPEGAQKCQKPRPFRGALAFCRASRENFAFFS
jgi:hypothetical protein